MFIKEIAWLIDTELLNTLPNLQDATTLMLTLRKQDIYEKLKKSSDYLKSQSIEMKALIPF